MRVTFPHMGNLYIALESIFNNLNIDVVTPPRINKETINIGTQNTPEAACLPFKIVLANFLQALNQGADTIIILGGHGPCRFGYFGSLAARILQDKGYSFNMIIFEKDNFIKAINEIKSRSGVSYWQVLRAVRFGWLKLKTIDDIEKIALINRSREIKPGVVSRLFDEALVQIEQAKEGQYLNIIKKRFISEVQSQISDKKVLKIGLVGDIYMMLEAAVNYRVEQRLGSMGAEVHRSIFLSDWLRNSLLPHKNFYHRRRLLEAGDPYLMDFVGGHGLDTVANTVLYAQADYDGVVQILPMTCMPEIVAQSVLPKIQNELGIPVLTLVLDEQSGEAGFATRIEAFVDLLQKRKQKIYSS